MLGANKCYCNFIRIEKIFPLLAHILFFFPYVGKVKTPLLSTALIPSHTHTHTHIEGVFTLTAICIITVQHSATSVCQCEQGLRETE